MKVVIRAPAIIINMMTAMIVVSASAWAGEPSSEIPERREFPVNPKFKPCDDFHQYVCSEVEASFKLREDRSYHDFAFQDSSERLLEAKKKFFAEIANEKSLSARDQQFKNYFSACMDRKAGSIQEKKALKTLTAELATIKKARDFAQYQVNNLEKGIESTFQFGGDSNKDNPHIYDVIVMTRLMNLPEYSYYDKPELMADYRELVIEYFKIVDPKQTQAKYESRADAMIAFEKEFVKIYPHPEILRQRWSEKRQEFQADFQSKYSNLPLKALFDRVPKALFVSNPVPEALDFVNQKMVDQNLNVLKDYYSYTMGSSLIDDSHPDYFKKQFDFNNKHLGGPNVRAVRPERCTKAVMGSFPMELDQLLTKRLFPNFPGDKLRKVVQRIRESVVSGLRNNSWLSPEAKRQGILKIEKAKLFLIQPQNDKEWNFRPIRKYSSKNKIENRRLLRKTDFEKKMSDLQSPVNLEAWGMGPLTVNAYYVVSANKFVLPIGILQYPFFDGAGTFSDNLGAVGAVIAHELGHAIDDQGSKFDEAGQLKQWMSMADLKEFTLRGQKMVDQFNKAGHNGSLTLGENVADLVGLSFAYNALFPEGAGTLEDKKNLFLAWGRVWCNVARPKLVEQKLKTDPHALGWARINEQVKHQPGFSEAFQCSKSDKLNLPESERIRIW